MTLIRTSNFGVRAPRQPATSSRPPPEPAGPTEPDRTLSLPRRPGWLLAALPDLAPSVAADLATLLADPALAALLAAAPSVHRALRPLLRALDLPTSETPPHPPPQSTPEPNPANPKPQQPSPLTAPPPPATRKPNPPRQRLAMTI